MASTASRVPPGIRSRQRAIKHRMLDLDLTSKALAAALDYNQSHMSRLLGTGIFAIADQKAALSRVEAKLSELEADQPAEPV